jgi:hypothetical protein
LNMTECLNSDDDDEANQRWFSSYFVTMHCQLRAAAGILQKAISFFSSGTRLTLTGWCHKQEFYDRTDRIFPLCSGLICR